MSKVKKVLRTIIAEEVAREVRKVIKENQETPQGQQEKTEVRKQIDKTFNESEMQTFKSKITTVPDLTKFLMELLDALQDATEVKSSDMFKALRSLVKGVKAASEKATEEAPKQS